MKLLITASRSLREEHYPVLKAAIEQYFPQATMILHGGAEGGDQLAARYAREQGLPQKVLRPEYRKHPVKAAPLLRNTELVALADATLAAYPGRPTAGTRDTSRKTLEAGKLLMELDVLTGHCRRREPAKELW